VRVTTSGKPADKGGSVEAISADGRHVLFYSAASNLAVAPSTHGTCVIPAEYGQGGQLRTPEERRPCSDLYATDPATGETELISIGLGGRPSNEGARSAYYFGRPAISAHGGYVVFTSDSTNLVAGRDSNKGPDVFLRDLKAHTTTLISIAR